MYWFILLAFLALAYFTATTYLSAMIGIGIILLISVTAGKIGLVVWQTMLVFLVVVLVMSQVAL